MNSSDGLAALQAQRAKASARHAPPPRHVAPTKPTAPAVMPESQTPATQPAGPAPTYMGALVRASIYLDTAADAFLEDVRIAARRATPRVDASRSAVVRLALQRLARDLEAAEIVDELRRRAAAAATAVTPGRRRL